MVQLSMGPNMIELDLAEAQELTQDLVKEFQEIIAIEEDNDGKEGENT